VVRLNDGKFGNFQRHGACGNGANWRTTRQLSGECRFNPHSFRNTLVQLA